MQLICKRCFYALQIVGKLQRRFSENQFSLGTLSQQPWLLFLERQLHSTKVVFSGSEQSTQMKTGVDHFDIKKLHSQSKNVYGWGNSTTGALGEQLPENTTALSTDVQKSPQIVYFIDETEHNYRIKPSIVAAGYGFTVVAHESANGIQLYGSGLNTYQQIGYHMNTSGSNLDVIMHPSEIKLPSKTAKLFSTQQTDDVNITSMSCGRAHTWVATNQKSLLSFGNNVHGQCGVTVRNSNRGGNEVSFDKRVKQVCCGMDHTIVLTSDGEVYSCGLGADGQTGLEHYGAVDVLTKVRGDIEGERIIHVCSKADCVLAVSDSGDVFGWGNSEYGQLSSVAGQEGQVNVARRLPFSIPNRTIIQVATTGTMCALLDNKGGVHTWGYGLLGHHSEPVQCHQPEMIPDKYFGTEVSRSQIVQIKSGLNHFAALTDTGELYMWGLNKNSCLGVESDQKQYSTPNKVCLPGRVDQVTCGVDHTLAICQHSSSSTQFC